MSTSGFHLLRYHARHREPLRRGGRAKGEAVFNKASPLGAMHMHASGSCKIQVLTLIYFQAGLRYLCAVRMYISTPIFRASSSILNWGW